MKECQVRDGIQEFDLDSWREFFDLTTTVFRAPAYIYRGQADGDWLVTSTLDRLEQCFPRRRNLTGDVPEFFEAAPLSPEEQLDAFRRAARGRVRSLETMSADDLWALGQHHGLATPLLDWTRSPFVALFFAFEEQRCLGKAGNLSEPDTRAVFALSSSAVADQPNAADESVAVFSPVANPSHRLMSQGALFVKMPRGTDLETLVRQQFKGETHQAILVKVRIPSDDRVECLVALDRMNIHRMSLFPDLDGAGRYINSLWEPGLEGSIAYV